MTNLVVTETAREDLVRLIATHSLPESASARVRASIARLALFPALGTALGDRLEGLRFLIGPWPWMVIVYRHDAVADTVIVLTIEDGRTSTGSARR